MTNSVSDPKTDSLPPPPDPKAAEVKPQKEMSGWETVMRCFVLLLGIFIGLFAALVIAGALGWLSLDLC